MTVRQNPQLNDDDLELLSAYIDNRLAAGERGALEARLKREPDLRGALDELRGTVALLHDLPALTPPRSFALDPVAFAPRRSPLFGWLRMGATLASVLLALTFAVDFVGRGALGGAGGGAASSAPAPAQMRALTTTEAPAAAAAPTSAPAAATSAPAAEAFAPAPTEAIAAAPQAPASAAGAAAAPTSAPAATTAPAAAIAAAPTAAAPAGATMRSADTSAGIAPTTLAGKSSQATPIAAQNQSEPSPAAGGALPPVAPLANPGSQSPDTLRLQQPSPAAAQPAPSAPTISPIRLVEVGLAALALLLGMGALWVRRRGP